MKNITKRKSLGCIFQLTLFDKCVNDLYMIGMGGPSVNFCIVNINIPKIYRTNSHKKYPLTVN